MELYDFDADRRQVTLKEWSKRKRQTIASRHFWLRRFPLISWLKSYSWTFAFYDVVAGVTVGLLVLPQCLAAATVAGLPPQYGLYSSIVGYFLYTALGTCRVINFGPTLLVSMLLRPYTDEYGPEAVVLITFLTGVIITLIAILQLAPIVEFISYPVLIGFMSAGVVNIILSQAVAMIGIKASSDNVIESIENIINGIDQFKLWDMVLGITCISILLLIWKIGDFFENSPSSDEKNKSDAVHTMVKYFALCRNALVMGMSMAFVAIMISINGESPVSTPGEIDEGFPPIRLPTFQLQQGNTTLTFGETLSELSSALFVAPLIVLLEFVSVAKAFSNGVSIDTTQEVLTLGLTNTLGSFIQSIPVTGSFTRSAVNNASGVKTPISGLYTGAIVVAVLGLLAHWLTFIPSATLSAVIISALLFLFRIPQVTKECINSSKRDLIPLYVTFVIGLFVNLTFAIVSGVLVDLIILIYPAARPNIIIKPTKLADIGDALLVIPDKNLTYSNIEYFKEQVRSCAAIVANIEAIAIDGSFIHSVDTTTIKSLKELVRDLQTMKGKKVLFLKWRPRARHAFVKFDGRDAEIFVPIVSQPTLEEVFTSGTSIY